MTETIVAILGTSAVAAAVGAWFGRRKTDAEATKLRADAEVTQGEGWQALLKAQQSQLDRLTSEVDSLRMAKLACEAELGELRRRLAALERDAKPAGATGDKGATRKPRVVNGAA